MSLLTKEQLRQLAEAHDALKRPIEEGTERLYGVALELSAALGDLTAIIDDLQARAPKQYTEQELREWLETCNNLSHADCPWVRHEPTHKLIKPEHMKYKDPRDEAMWFAVHNFARMSGALKAEP